MSKQYNIVKNGRVISKIRVSSLTESIVYALIGMGYRISGNYKGI